MSISTYSELQTAVANWLEDSNLTSRIPEFISLAEAMLNRKLRLLHQEVEATSNYDPSDASRYPDLPTNYIELFDIRIKATGEDDAYYIPLRYIAPDRIYEKYHQTAGKPVWYTIRNAIELDRLPDVVYVLRMHYLKRWDIANDLTNWLLTNYPDIYLYSTLLQAEPYLGNDSRIATWKEMLRDAIEEANEADQMSRDDETLSTNDLSLMSSNYRGYDVVRDQ